MLARHILLGIGKNWAATSRLLMKKEGWVNQKLRNPYEESKLKAEVYLKKKRKELGLKITYYRISVAVGRYEDGFANNFSGYYNFCKFMVLRDRIAKRF